jgi:transposase
VDLQDLRTENESLRRLLAQRDAELADERFKRQVVEESNERLAHELEMMKRRLFGKKHERFELDPAQLSLLTIPTPAPNASTEGGEKNRQKRRHNHGRRTDPAPDAPRRKITRPLPSNVCCTVCGGALKKIGEATSRRVEWIPGHFENLDIALDKCVCPHHPEAGVVTADPPPFALPKAMCGDGLLARVLVDKFGDHIPLNREVVRLAREGFNVSSGTLSGWVAAGAGVLRVIYDVMFEAVLAGRWLQADATGQPVQDGRDGELRKGHLFTYSNDDHIVFKFAATKEGVEPAAHLEGFKGEVVLVDGGSEFNLIARDGIARAGCWSHARRKFFEARDTEPIRVAEALTQIRDLFMIERHARGRPPPEVQELRDALSRPILAKFLTWLRDLSTHVRPTSPLGRAVSYTLNQWDRLNVFLDHPEIPIHNNTAERSLRQPVVGRKNWLFAGSEGGAEAGAIVFSMVGSCIHHAIDPWTYLNDVLPRINDHPRNKVHELTPVEWKAIRLARA